MELQQVRHPELVSASQKYLVIIDIIELPQLEDPESSSG